MAHIQLQAADSIEIITIMDNVFDMLLAGSDHIKRFPLHTDVFHHPLPIAEHGFSALVKITRGGTTRKLLFDTGVSEDGIMKNLAILGETIEDIDAIVLSHGHTDHAMGLMGVLRDTGRKNLPFVIHPDAYLPRKLVLPNGYEINIPAPSRSELLDKDIELIESVGPSFLFDNVGLVSGEISRTTEFEKGFPIHYAKREGKWVLDPYIYDDQCFIVNLRGKGLVILTGCGHAGIVNIIRNAQQLTGVDKIYAVMGGFHLSGAVFEPIIDPTVNELVKLNPSFIIPGHCTGWKATHEIARRMPKAFVQNSVGTRIVLV
jgi:7,8-dihydropterin-6-yl-methyl-4-(beta-D-ribofuranosyl)aminobenzene 5'-phosphate synthase